jgi:Na+/proline symporter
VPTLSTLDWAIVAAVLGISLFLGLAFTRRASQSTSEYFLSGRNLPWWLLGTSMVATTFSADTPLAVTELVREGGIWRNWYWWAAAFSHVLAALVFSRLWRRAEVLTDNELIEIRYSGRPAAALRAFKAAYFSLLVNVIVMAWVLNAMGTIVTTSLGIPFGVSVVLSSAIALVYTVSAGLWGVMVTDLFQFGVAMIGAIAAAYFAVDAAGGLSALRAAVDQGSRLDIIPTTAEALPQFLTYVLLLWWSNHSADGGGYFIQRMSAAKNEDHARAGTLWFCLAHYALRSWPWIVVALATLVLLPEAHPKAAYPELAMRVMPEGWRGVLVASLIAAFMSTIVTHLNWGASYVVHDLYRRFWRPHETERHYVRAARLASLGMMALGAVAAFTVDSISGAWVLVSTLGGGLGPILILRWFWWRVNAWSEITALGVSALLAGPLAWLELPDWQRFLILVPTAVGISLAVTLLTRPEPLPRLEAFYARVRPGGYWGSIARGQTGSGIGRGLLFDWVMGLALILGLTLGMGELLFGSAPCAAAWGAAALTGGVVLTLRLRKTGTSARECSR